MPPIPNSPLRGEFFAAAAHSESEIEQAKIAERRARTALQAMRLARKAWAASIPSGAGFAHAHDVPWEHWYYDNHTTHNRWTCRLRTGGFGPQPYIDSALDEMCEIARIVGQPITETFQGSFSLTCSPGDTPRMMRARWEEESTAPEVVGAG